MADVVQAYCDEAIVPACAEFARRVGADSPSAPADGRVGCEVKLPPDLKDSQAKSVLVVAEPFDDEAFTVKTSRPDSTDQLRQIALVRYDDLNDSAGRAKSVEQVRGLVANALSQLQQGLSNR